MNGVKFKEMKAGKLCSSFEEGEEGGPRKLQTCQSPFSACNLDAGLEGILNNFKDDTKLGGAVDSLEGRKALWKDLNKSEDWAITNRMKFNNGKCQILHMGWNNP
ncbi:rna-directed dna polymerase from mobile element jockey-like [Pitangus sulphuratus]|nr:rna-directed dna polymerase from mobile element jockey-like [Pitangus sulphuratus]